MFQCLAAWEEAIPQIQRSDQQTLDADQDLDQDLDLSQTEQEPENKQEDNTSIPE